MWQILNLSWPVRCFDNVSHELNTILIFNQIITTTSKKSNHHKRVLNDNINKQKTFWSQIKNVFPRKSQSMANVSTDRRSSLNILSRFTVQWHQS